MYRFGFVLFFLLNAGVLGAQSLHFKNISIEDGLPSTECYEVLQDREGYMWISTDAGLCRYNGRQFKVFTIEDGLPSNTMFEIMEDQHGRLWGACFNGGIFYIHHDTVYTITANVALKQNGSTTKEIIVKLILDEKEVLHVGTTANYYTITPQNNYASITSMNANFTDKTAYFLTFVNHQALYGRLLYPKSKYNQFDQIIWANNRKYIFSPQNTRLSNTWDYYALMVDANSYFVSFSGTLFYFKGGVHQSKEFDHNIITLYQDSKKNLWIGFRQKGFLMFPRSDLSQTPVKGLETESASSFFEDREGAICITTTSNGVYYCSNTDVRYYDDLLNKRVVGLGIIDNKVLVSTSTYVIYQLDSSGARVILDLSKYQIENEKIDFTCINGLNYKTGGIAFVFDLKGNHQTIKYKLSEDPHDIAQVIDMEGVVWGVNSGHLLKLENASVMMRYKLPSRGFCLLYTRRKELLVGCLNGLYAFNNGNFSKLRLDNEKNEAKELCLTDQLMDNEKHEVRISCLTEDESGNLIVGTKGRGLFIRTSYGWYHLDEKAGLASNNCNEVFCDGRMYYVSTNRGYSVINTTHGIEFTNINLSNGIPSDEVNKVARYGDRIYVITEKGACSYSAEESVYNSESCELVVNRILLRNQPLYDQGEYPFYQNDLFFSCDVLSYQKPVLNKIKYQLFPVDKMPRYSSTFDINYDNLPPGSYTLYLQGVNNNGVEGKSKVYHFSIRKPVWNRWWFVVLAVMFFLLGVYAILRRRVLYIRKKESEKNALKEKIVEFHYMALRAQMNPHFIFNVINSIQLYVLQNQPKQAYHYLSKFSKLIRRVLQNSKEKLITLADELEMIRLYLDLEKIRLEDDVEFEIFVDEGIEENRVLIPSMIIQPILENAIWHGIVPLDGIRPGKVYLKIFQTGDKLMISIKDNGVGIQKDDEKTKKSSMGLDLIKDRLALLSNRTNFKVVRLVDDHGEIQGTEVIISFPIIIMQ
jgi:ligand-binding sensor domain-containing protein